MIPREKKTQKPPTPKKETFFYDDIPRLVGFSKEHDSIKVAFLEPKHPVTISKTLVVVLTFFYQVDTAGISSLFLFSAHFSPCWCLFSQEKKEKKENLFPNIRNIRKRMTTFIFTRVCKCIFCKFIFLVKTILLSFQSGN